ncbi:MAG: DUF624 domain-containing protein [Ruminococcaceae bacterium]|nr:DUF624 domain-containing protein [Oscillospiraceae bacterium]
MDERKSTFPKRSLGLNVHPKGQKMDNQNLGKKNKKFSLYRLFNPQGNGKGVEPLPEGPDNIAKCFKLLGRNLTNMLYLNLLLIFGNFPILFFLLGYNLMVPTTTAASPLFATVQGAAYLNPSPAADMLISVYGLQQVRNVPTTGTYICFALMFLIIFTFGFVNTGVTYIMRSMVRQQPYSVFGDFFHAIKKNWKQSLIFGVIDSVILGLLAFDIYFYYINSSALMYMNILILCFYMIMRYYIYLLLITFDLSIWKIIKNSLIFLMLNFKRNFFAFSGMVIMVIIEIALISFAAPIGLMFPFVFFFSIPMFFGIYAAYPKIKEIMIDPQIN